MSQSACSTPESAPHSTGPPRQNAWRYIVCQSRSISNGSAPTRYLCSSSIAPSIARSLPEQADSPIPTIPSSVCSFTYT